MGVLVAWLEFDSRLEMSCCPLEITLFKQEQAKAVMRPCIVGIALYGLPEVEPCFSIVALLICYDTFIVISLAVAAVELYGFSVEGLGPVQVILPEEAVAELE